ncbi:PIN domain-containing protein [Campylobacter jejuni]|uniref:PIN-like domain-containing protein n=1 Tax=Campylobacter jejuni TaxID=197 RepID=A0A430WPI2_CAMJU|nr:PIN domain-containing protein [Campylobacter jejuni]RTI73754.1 hypothetical protein C3I15_02900 [Campylobacter jejuni]RTI83610.1 hypothetical protein C3I10_03900 [Campylobacter jejuni]RTJ05458.1 hypothetical protein C3H99_04160 [Campylobacter jejuni]RTJ48033.1 hypothetical protein C3H68_02940 [Campylobacter jejuni]RTJ80330.1 hypothetical protein C3H57_02145 [Campylobacter jejuni]
MRAYLIDAENINLDHFFNQYHFDKKDKKSVFYLVGNANIHFSFHSLSFLCKHKFKIHTFTQVSKDYADKIILTLLGTISKKPKIKKIFIVSNDKIFDHLEYIRISFKKNIKLVKFNNQTNPPATPKPSKIEVYFSKNKENILALKNQAQNKADFHNLLAKNHSCGAEIYAFIKEKYPKWLKAFNDKENTKNV